ncbi:ATP-dependent zinc metalloprotease FtsH [Ruminococcaceae bacterium OttesenSCG-928-L11]|nr:ATP-dependent zinc metalloprotease FtsH [Ruminococcaceae bacterium OttesenSCG-928-L11]
MSQPNQSNPKPGGGDTPPTGGKWPSILNIFIVMFLITFVMNIVASQQMLNARSQISYSQFMSLIESGSVSHVQMGDTEYTIALKPALDYDAVNKILERTGLQIDSRSKRQVILYTGYISDQDLLRKLEHYDIEYTKPITRESPLLSFITSWIIPLVLMYVIYYFFMKRIVKRMGGDGVGGGMMGGMGNVGKSKAKVYTVEKSTGVTFADVAGQDEAKESLAEMVDYLHNPEKYQKIGAKQPKGALLVGPPGTGKTLLAKAVAGEAQVPFYSLSGSEFVEMFVGVGASRVRDLFQQANKNAPCIIFIDEIDAIGKKRDNQMGGNDEREQTLNQLLAEMDGFDSGKGILVLAATNRPEILDKALLRPGRFDRRVIVDKPDLPGREAILKVHADKIAVGPDIDLHAIALATSGATGADLANMINEAALRAVKMGRHSVLHEDLMESVEVVIAGKEKKDRVLNPKEREMVAYHEVGHALVTALQKDATPVKKITIVPRTMGSLGYTMNVPEDERYLLTKEELIAQINTLLGGRAAEIVQFGVSTTGASNDIERATRLARSMVTQYGMSDAFGSMGLESTENQYLDGRNVATCSEQTIAKVDEEVRKLIDSCQETAIQLLEANKDALHRISEYLLDKENITGEEFMRVLKETDEQAE